MARKFILCFLLLLMLLCPLMAAERPMFALVLSGGGAKGIAHIPVLKELDRRGLVPDLIVGTSMGAIMGSLYAAGYTGEELENLVVDTDLMHYFTHFHVIRGSGLLPSVFTDFETNLVTVEFGTDVLGSANGLLDDQYINGFLRLHLSKVLSVHNFDELSIPLRTVGTDITNNKKVVFASGSLFDAVRASMAIPIVFSPVRLQDGSYIVDGGIEDNLPADIARDLGADVVLAVDVDDSFGFYGTKNHDMDTLTGAFNQFTDYLVSPNSRENYSECDWVIVPDISGFGTMSFEAAAEILERGNQAVERSMDTFDKLEERLKNRIPTMSRVAYDDIEAPIIESVEFEEVIPQAHRGTLDAFEGRPMDYETVSELEAILVDIRRHEGFRSVFYEINGGTITIRAERYPALSGSINLGLVGGLGVRYDGPLNKPYFSYTPEFSVSGKVAILPRLELEYGVVVDEGIALEAGVSYPFLESAFLYANAGIKYGQLAYFSIPGTPNYSFSNDIGANIKFGIGYIPMPNMRLDGIIGFDYSYIGSSALGNRHFYYPYTGIGFGFNDYDTSDITDNGMRVKAILEIGGDFPDVAFAYSFSASFFGCYGPTDTFKFIGEAETATIRRSIELSEAYRATKLGVPATDYIHLMGGVRIPLPKSFFIDAGIFFEAFGGSFDDLDGRSRNLVPYSELMMGENTMDIGGYIGGGMATPFGSVRASLYISATPRVSFMLGIE